VSVDTPAQEPSKPVDVASRNAFRLLLQARRADCPEELDGLPPSSLPEPLGLFTVARRGFLQRTLQQIDGALKGMADGTYGACQRCSRAIPVAMLEAWPLVSTCKGCATLRRRNRQVGA
jgi:hypothetical protein